jgi:GxxExxY protein
LAEDAKVTENEIGDTIIASALKIHTALGPGLLESANETCLMYELQKHGLPVQRQVLIPARYEDLTIDNGYRVDLLIEDRVVVERKALEAILPVHCAQLLSYLRLGHFKLDYLLNVNVARMRDGITRSVNGL